MRILLAHNFYQSGAPSGEDAVYRNERAMLEAAGHEIVPFERHNDALPGSLLGRAGVAADSLWSRRTYRDLRALIARTRPQIAHFHNTFPQITPSAYLACRDSNVPVVQTLHNYRLLCPNGLFLRDARPCEACLQSGLTNSIRHGCYRDSRVATSIVAAGLQLNRGLGSFTRHVDRYIALTAFARKRFVAGGLPAERIAIRPNGLGEAPQVGTGDGGFALFVGRLTREKGIQTLVRAWAMHEDELPLLIAGDGALREPLQSQYSGPRIRFLGAQPREEVWSLMQRASLLIVPSECYEGFPLTVIEGLASGAPIVAAAIGALEEIVSVPEHGEKFRPGDADDLIEAVRRLRRRADPEIRPRNRRAFEERYSRQVSLRSLLAIYEEVLGGRWLAAGS